MNVYNVVFLYVTYTKLHPNRTYFKCDLTSTFNVLVDFATQFIKLCQDDIRLPVNSKRVS